MWRHRGAALLGNSLHNIYSRGEEGDRQDPRGVSKPRTAELLTALPPSCPSLLVLLLAWARARVTLTLSLFLGHSLAPVGCGSPCFLLPQPPEIQQWVAVLPELPWWHRLPVSSFQQLLHGIFCCHYHPSHPDDTPSRSCDPLRHSCCPFVKSKLLFFHFKYFNSNKNMVHYISYADTKQYGSLLCQVFLCQRAYNYIKEKCANMEQRQ